MKKMIITLIPILLIFNLLATAKANCKYNYQTYKKYSYKTRNIAIKYDRYYDYDKNYDYDIVCFVKRKKSRSYSYSYYNNYSYSYYYTYYSYYDPYELILKLYRKNYINKNSLYPLIKETYNNIKITYYDSNEKNFKQIDQ